jgi:hypothetical protein
MLKFLLAYKTFSLEETPELLYLGHDGDELEEARQLIGPEFVRATMINGASEFPVSIDEQTPDSSVEAEEILQSASRSSKRNR